MRINFYIFITFFLFIFSVNLVAQKEQEFRPQYSPHSEKNKNRIDEMGRKQGLWRYYTRDGVLLLEITFQNDIKHGPCVRHNSATGIISEESNYFNGKRDGDYKRYSTTGILITEGNYTNNRKTGTWTSYYPVNGEKKCEGVYQEGKREGKWVYYSSKGKLRMMGDYVNGLREGEWTTYNEDGSVMEQKKYVKGVAPDENKTVTNTTKTNKKAIKKQKQQTPINNNSGSGTTPKPNVNSGSQPN
ncbi:MAG: hypothetical protein WCQ95_05765 [Bacteroidota bacterium]